MNIKDSKIVVTGGSLGIGKETAKRLVEKGAQVVSLSAEEGKRPHVEKTTSSTDGTWTQT